MSSNKKIVEYPNLNLAITGLHERLSELKEDMPKLEIRSVCFHRVDPITGGNWFIRVRGHIKTENGAKGF
jgi:hypothetical protein